MPRDLWRNKVLAFTEWPYSPNTMLIWLSGISGSAIAVCNANASDCSNRLITFPTVHCGPLPTWVVGILPSDSAKDIACLSLG